MIILASKSTIRKTLLENAGLTIEAHAARVDEDMIKAALIAEKAKPRDIADALAETKAKKISTKFPTTTTLGCDQILECEGQIYNKCENKAELKSQLQNLRNKTHRLISAAVFAKSGQPIWRQISEAQIKMRDYSDDFLENYIETNFEDIRHSLGGYQLESQGINLIEDYRGDYFAILGLPLFAILNQLRLWGELPK